MSAFAASSWAAIVSVAHQLEQEAAGLDPPVAQTLRGLARRLHTARLLGRRLFLAAPPSEPSPVSEQPMLPPSPAANPSERIE
jgi:hypothetical protein